MNAKRWNRKRGIRILIDLYTKRTHIYIYTDTHTRAHTNTEPVDRFHTTIKILHTYTASGVYITREKQLKIICTRRKKDKKKKKLKNGP